MASLFKYVVSRTRYAQGACPFSVSKLLSPSSHHRQRSSVPSTAMHTMTVSIDSILNSIQGSKARYSVNVTLRIYIYAWCFSYWEGLFELSSEGWDVNDIPQYPFFIVKSLHLLSYICMYFFTCLRKCTAHSLFRSS